MHQYNKDRLGYVILDDTIPAIEIKRVEAYNAKVQGLASARINKAKAKGVKPSRRDYYIAHLIYN